MTFGVNKYQTNYVWLISMQFNRMKENYIRPIWYFTINSIILVFVEVSWDLVMQRTIPHSIWMPFNVIPRTIIGYLHNLLLCLLNLVIVFSSYRLLFFISVN